MITLTQASDLDARAVQAVAYDRVRLGIDDGLLRKVDVGRRRFLALIANGVPCYGVTTGLGRLAGVELSAAAARELPHNILRARAVAIGPPFGREIARSLMTIRLCNFLSGVDGVRSGLCRFLVDRLNDDFTPWVPSQGHGMAADAIANTHAFQTFIGEGFVFGPDGSRQPAAEALAERGAAPMEIKDKEGLALVNGVTAAPACAIHAERELARLLSVANLVAASSMEGLGAPKDGVDVRLKNAGIEPGTAAVIETISTHLHGSCIESGHLQAPVSYRIVPQVHGALHDALESLRQRIDQTLSGFSGNPLMVAGDGGTAGRLLSVGLFHNQHLVNQIDQVALSLAHVGCLSERRVHRLLDAGGTGLPPQLAARPGLDAGLVVAQKGSLGLAARLRLLAMPVSLHTGESSGGQEDYMSMALPAVSRLFEMTDLVRAMLAYELLCALVALDRRGRQPGLGVARVRDFFRAKILPLDRDRAPGPDVETIIKAIDAPEFRRLLI